MYPAALQKSYTPSGMFSYEHLRTTLTAACDRCIFQSLLSISFYFEYKGNHLHTPYVMLSPLKLVISARFSQLFSKIFLKKVAGYNAKTFYAKLEKEFIVCIEISTPPSSKTPPPLSCQPPLKSAKCPSPPF